MSVQREGGCACGALRYRLASEPMFVHCCHCLNCQRQTGSAFVINLLIEADRVELLAGEPVPVDAPRDDGSVQRIFRCPACQVAVFSQYRAPQVRFVRAGTLDDPASVAPDVHIFTRSKVPWVTLPEGTPAFEVYYDTQALWPAESLARLEAAMVTRDVGRLRPALDHLHAVGLDQQVDHEGAAGLPLTVQAVTAVREQRLRAEPVANGAAGTSTFP